MELSSFCKVDQVLAYTATGTTDLLAPASGAPLDMSGWDGCIFVGALASFHAANFVYAQGGSLANGSDLVDLAGTRVTPTADGNTFLLDIYKPLNQFLSLYVERGGATTISQTIYAIRYKAHKGPLSLTVTGTTIAGSVGRAVISPIQTASGAGA